MGDDNIDHAEIPEFSSCEDMIIGYAVECGDCGKEMTIYATHELPLCPECEAKKSRR